MLSSLRDNQGKPSGSVRLLAFAVALGMLMLAAPALVPILRWAGNLVF
jgi:hypothetical protein